MPSTRSRTKLNVPAAPPSATAATSQPNTSNEDSSHRPTKRARIEKPEPTFADLNFKPLANGGVQAQTQTIEEQEAEGAQPSVDTKDPSSRASDLYLDTVRVTVV